MRLNFGYRQAKYPLMPFGIILRTMCMPSYFKYDVILVRYRV